MVCKKLKADTCLLRKKNWGSTVLNHPNLLKDATKYSVRVCYVLGATLKKNPQNNKKNPKNQTLLKKNCSFSARILQTKIPSNWPKNMRYVTWFPSLEEKTQPKEYSQLDCYFSAVECDSTAQGCMCCWRKPHTCGGMVWRFQTCSLSYRAATLWHKDSRSHRQNTTLPGLHRNASILGCLIPLEMQKEK